MLQNNHVYTHAVKPFLNRVLSVLLCLIFLFELLPGQVLGGLLPRAAAVELPAGTVPNSVTEQPISVNVQIPETFLYETQTAAQSAEESDGASGTRYAFTGTPYLYDRNSSESLLLNTGALVYSETDYVLPGNNGLDLVFARRYNSDEASMYLADIFLSDTELRISISQRKNAPGSFSLGLGWELAFSYLEINGADGQHYLHLSDGRVLQVNLTEDMVHLVGYELQDLGFQSADLVLLAPADAAYCLTHADGTKEFFDDNGRLIKISNRFGDAITFARTTTADSDVCTITDTRNRVVRITTTSTQTGKLTEVLLPDGNNILYTQQTGEGTKPITALASVTDVMDQTTLYSYTVQTGLVGADAFDSGNAYSFNNPLLHLTTVTHHTGAQTVFDYELASRGLGESFYVQVGRLVSREDREYGETLNREVYAYSTYHYTGYPRYNPTDLPETFTYTTTITNEATGLSTICTFDNENLLTVKETGTQATTCQTVAYVYNTRELPIQETVRTYSAGNQTAPVVTVIAREYDEHGNVVSSWSSNADGDTTNTEYKTATTYDSWYNLTKTVTYKISQTQTVQVVNTLTSDHRNIAETVVSLNDTPVSRTAYTYQNGRLLTETRYLDPADPAAGSILTEYSYHTDGTLASQRQSNVTAFDGSLAMGSSGTADGVIETNYTYDTMGRLLSVTDGNGNTTSYQYDAGGNVTQVTNPDNSTVRYERNYAQNTVTLTDERGYQTRQTYTPLGLEYETVIVDANAAHENLVAVRKEYDSASRLIQVSDFVHGAVTEYTYDALSRVTSETVKQGETVLAQTLYAYDDAAENGLYQKVTKTVAGDANAPDMVTTQYTDKHGNVVKTGKFLGGTEYFDTYTYDYAGNNTQVLTAADAEKNLSFTAKYEYNENGQVTKSFNAENAFVTNSYNALGQLVSATDYAGTPTTYTYDALGRLLTQSITVEEGVTAVSKYEYDANGNIIREWKPTNAVGAADTWAKTEYTYDSRNQLTAVSQYNGDTVAAATTYTYDACGNLLTMTAGGKTTTYTYDRFGNVLTMTDALNQTETCVYSALGRLESKTDRNGNTTTYAYDAAGRILSTVSGTDAIVYTYTLTGQLRTEENNWQKTTYTYDELGRVTVVAETKQTTVSVPEAPPAPDPVPEENPEGTITITLDPAGGTLDITQTAPTEEGTYTLPTPTRTGYTFDGWYLASHKVASGDELLLDVSHTLTAHWTAHTYTIHFFGNGGQLPIGNGGSTAGHYTQDFTYDEEKQLTGNRYELDGSTFLGWGLTTNTVVYTDGQAVKNLTDADGGTDRCRRGSHGRLLLHQTLWLRSKWQPGSVCPAAGYGCSAERVLHLRYPEPPVHGVGRRRAAGHLHLRRQRQPIQPDLRQWGAGDLHLQQSQLDYRSHQQAGRRNAFVFRLHLLRLRQPENGNRPHRHGYGLYLRRSGQTDAGADIRAHRRSHAGPRA